jgi:pimeloyl-ACP methyl ester carboxylesterase
MRTLSTVPSLPSACCAMLAGFCIVGAGAFAAEPASHFARSGTNKVHYTTAGEGKQTVVFIHGWGGNTHFWREQMPAMRDKARLIVVDLPGHGESDKPKVDYTMDFFARAVVDVLRDAKVERATLVGHSMGVVVLCRAHALAPERVAGLVAVDGLLRRPKIDAEQAEGFVAPYRTPEYRDQVKKFIGAMYPNPGTDTLRDWTIAEILTTPQYVLSSSMDAMFKSTQPWDLDKVKVPLIVINAKSPMWTPEYEAYARSLSDHVEYQTLEGTGHFVMLEKPAEFNAALVKALETQHLAR